MAMASVVWTKNGAGTQTMTGSLYYTGTTTVNQGLLQLWNVCVFDSNALAIASGGTFQVNDAGPLEQWQGSGNPPRAIMR